MDASLTTILEVALQQGIWAALYIYLFFRMLKENAQREEKYQGMIENNVLFFLCPITLLRKEMKNERYP